MGRAIIDRRRRRSGGVWGPAFGRVKGELGLARAWAPAGGLVEDHHLAQPLPAAQPVERALEIVEPDPPVDQAFGR